MRDNISEIEILISKSISGNATPEEHLQLEEWKAASKSNQEIYKKTLKAWEKSTCWISDESVQQDKLKVQHENNKQLLIRFQKIKRQSFIYKIAALFAIPITFGISMYFLSNTPVIEPKAQYCEITSPKGHVSKCILPDGSEVWINTGSTITYNTASFNQQDREIQLSGEAYFEVTKNIEKPFKVVTPAANINVTGTSFNVKAYPESEVFETVLSEGSIEMHLKNQFNQIINLLPEERAVYSDIDKEITIEKVDADFFTSWRNGEILFKDATLNDLVKELERIYDIQFHVVDPKLGEFRFRGMFSYNNNLIDALEKIRRTANIDYYIENKEVWLGK